MDAAIRSERATLLAAKACLSGAGHSAAYAATARVAVRGASAMDVLAALVCSSLFRGMAGGKPETPHRQYRARQHGKEEEAAGGEGHGVKKKSSAYQRFIFLLLLCRGKTKQHPPAQAGGIAGHAMAGEEGNKTRWCSARA